MWFKIKGLLYQSTSKTNQPSILNHNLMRASQQIQGTGGNSAYHSMMDELLDRGGYSWRKPDASLSL